MRLSSIPGLGVVFVVLGASLSSGRIQAQFGQFTVQIGTPPLVRHGEVWRYRKSLTAPPANWTTLADASLDASWLSGAGGIGFGDSDDATTVSDMRYSYYSLYLHRSFQVSTPIDPARHLQLVMDYDDGFIAYLDGAEVARSANVPGAVGTPHPYDLGLATDHEALGYRGLAAEVYDLGPVGSRLAPGTHILAIQVINGTIDSSDVSLIADLQLTGGQDVADGALLSLVATNALWLTGSNTLPGSTRVVVNGVDANYASASGEWSRLQPLVPGMNRLFFGALDANGVLLGSVSRDVVAVLTSTAAGGVLTGNTTWSPALGCIRVTNDLAVPAGITLTIEPGTVVLLATNGSVRATNSGSLVVQGTVDQPVYFLPADGASSWREVSAGGPGSGATLRGAEVVAGQVRVLNGATLLVEDSILRDLPTGGREILAGIAGADLTLRRTYAARFSEIDSRDTPVLVEDCLMEEFFVDGLDIKGDGVPLIVRRSTFRNADPGNTNADALDFGPGAGYVERCLIHHFPDKGVSIGGAPGTVVRDSLIHHCGIGISGYASTGCVFLQSTIAQCTNGILLRENPTAAFATGTNLVVWGNTNPVVISGTSILSLAYCDIEGTNWPGSGNVSIDPQFVAAALGDYRLAPESPVRFAGYGDVDMGVPFPVGGIPPAPFHLEARTAGTNAIQLGWHEDADNEAGFEIQRSPDATNWAFVASVNAGETAWADTSAALAQLHFYRVRATNSSGLSRFSNVASAARQLPVLIAGGVLSSNTTWSPSVGTVLVTSPVAVPHGLTLRIEAGTLVHFTNGAYLRATAGGTLDVAGSAAAPVQFIGANPTNIWGGLGASGTGAVLTVRHADIRGGFVGATNATMLIEDTYLHDYKNGGYAIGGCEFSVVTLRRCHFAYYHETLWRASLMTIEESLFEWSDNPSSDALDFDGALPGSIIRRCTFRHGPQTNTDAIDVGSGLGFDSINVAIVDTLMYDFPTDGGVSGGEGVWGLTVSNCLVYGCRGAIKCKETPGLADMPTTMGIYQCTFVDNVVAGISNYTKSCSTCLAGQETNSYNNIVYGNPMDIVLLGQGVLVADHSLFGSTNVVGNGTFNAGPGVITGNPLFVNAALRDYRLQAGSPALTAGRDGASLGCRFPVGAPMASSHPQIESVEETGGSITVRFWADSEKAYTLQSCDSLANPQWGTVTNVPTRALPEHFEVTRPIDGNRYFRLTTP